MNYLFYLYNAKAVEIVFKDQLLLDLFIGNKTNNKQFRSNPVLIKKFKKTIIILNASKNLNTLSKISGLNYERLKGNLIGYASVRIDKKYRLIIREVYYDLDPEKLKQLEIIEISNHYS